MAVISQELIAALDDLIQAGASASSALRQKLEQVVQSNPKVLGVLNQVAVSQGVLNNARTAQRNEVTVPQLLTQVRDAVQRLSSIASSVGESGLAGSLSSKVQSISAQMKAAGVGLPWLTILGVGAGAVAAWYLWKRYNKTKQVASFERPEPEDVGPRLRGLGKSLGSFRSSFGRAPGCRQLGRGKRLGGTEYQFEPETRLEGFRRGPRRRKDK